MPEFSTLLIFLAAALALLVIPGPAVLYIVARSVDQGRLAGVVSVLGIATGSLFHIAAAALGLSALLMSSATLFLGVKYLGAAYLIYLGVRQLLVKKESHQLEVKGSRKLTRVFYEGILVNVLNPKTALFFFAFLPQFVDVNKGAASTQILFLGALFTVMGLCSDGLYALLAGSAGRWLKRNTGVLSAQRYFAGTVYLLLGVTTALSGSGRTK